jgi:hypothetical protein
MLLDFSRYASTRQDTDAGLKHHANLGFRVLMFWTVAEPPAVSLQCEFPVTNSWAGRFAKLRRPAVLIVASVTRSVFAHFRCMLFVRQPLKLRPIILQPACGG